MISIFLKKKKKIINLIKNKEIKFFLIFIELLIGISDSCNRKLRYMKIEKNIIEILYLFLYLKKEITNEEYII